MTCQQLYGMSSHHYVTYILWQVIDFLKLLWEREGGREIKGRRRNTLLGEGEEGQRDYFLSIHTQLQKRTHTNHLLSDIHLQVNNAQQSTPKHWNLSLASPSSLNLLFLQNHKRTFGYKLQSALIRSQFSVCMFGFWDPKRLPSPKSWLVLPLSLSVSSLWRHFGRRMVLERLSLRVTGARLWPKDCIRQFMRATKRKSPGPWRITSFASHVYRHLYLFFFFFIMNDVFNTHAQIARRHGGGVGKIKIFHSTGKLD